MSNNKKTKIIATLGPASNTKEIISELIDKGVNVFRINFSHADYDNVKARIKDIREIHDEKNIHVAILADLQGPKLRVGVMEDNVVLNENDTFVFTTDKSTGTKEKAVMTYQNFLVK